MINLGIAKKESRKHNEVCNFAHQTYLERLGIELTAFPNAIIYAEEKEKIIGSFGLTPGNDKNPLLVETYFNFNLLEYLSMGRIKEDRSVFGEIGTLATAKDTKTYISLLLCAAMVVWSKQQKYKFLAMTTTKVIQRMAKPLGINLISIGEPDLTNKDEDFQKKWEKYFGLKPSTIGVNTEQAFPGCFKILTEIPDVNYQSLFA